MHHYSINPLAETLLGLIHAQRLSVAELAARSGLYPSTLSQIINGHTKPQRLTLFKLAKALRVSLRDLEGGDRHE